MNGDSKVVGLWPRREHAEEPDSVVSLQLTPEASAAPEARDTLELENEAPERRPRRIADYVAMAAAAVWLGLVSAVYIPGWFVQAPSFQALVVAIAAAAAPLVLILLVHNLVTHNDAQALRSARDASAIMRAEQARLSATLASVTEKLREQQAEIAETSNALMAIGEDATGRLRSASSGMREEINTLTRHGQSLKFSATSARADMAVLLADLPKAQVETRTMVKSLQDASISAQESASALTALLSSLAERGREADSIAMGASQKLAAQLERVESVAGTGTANLEATTQRMSEAVDAALAHATQANETIQNGIAAQSAALSALVDQSQASIARTGADAATALSARVEDVSTRLAALATLLTEQTGKTSQLLAAVREGLDSAHTGIAVLEERGTVRTEQLAAAIASLDNNAKGLSASLAEGSAGADALIARSETLMTALDAALREVDESLPGAFERIDARVAATSPAIAALGTVAGSALDRMMEAESVLARQQSAIEALSKGSEANVTASHDVTAKLIAALEEANAKAATLAETASTQLSDALTRIHEASHAAADKARDAIAAIIPQSVGTLSNDARDALKRAITEEIETQIERLGKTAEDAVSSANVASERLMRQMTSIADLSGSVEKRISEGQASIEKTDSDALSRRVALLIESLNSTAIDVNKLLSNDVTDTSWQAYLRGDRGAFTRRAVRLLDTGEARVILKHYEAEPEFHEHVNHYIRDFELMLRDVLSTREGSALAITLLSSDMGKLYVALAQAIERLRA